MSKTSVFDVFLSSSALDRGLAGFVIEAFAEHGIHVFHVDDLRPGVSIEKRIREVLVECSSVVILVTPSSIGSQNLAFETGMAMAWSKPVFVLYDGVSSHEIPAFLKRFRIFPVSQVGKVATVIRESQHALEAEELDVLGRIYAEYAIPLDRLLLQPSDLAQMVREFAVRTGRDVGGERIARELMRLRKSGRLPRIKPIASSASPR